jgi:hypothetical protein
MADTPGRGAPLHPGEQSTGDVLTPCRRALLAPDPCFL